MFVGKVVGQLWTSKHVPRLEGMKLLLRGLIAYVEKKSPEAAEREVGKLNERFRQWHVDVTLSGTAVREMTGTQTDELLNKGKGEGGYGLGLSTTRKAKADGPVVAGPCGHGGAYATNLWIDPDKKLVVSANTDDKAHLNMQPFLTMMFGVAVQGIFPSQN